MGQAGEELSHWVAKDLRLSTVVVVVSAWEALGSEDEVVEAISTASDG